MVGMTMCTNNACPKFKECYRAQAEPTPFWQSWCQFEYDEDGECEYFVELVGGMRLDN